jgi:hydrogenase nickel incorporation protein HypA/HybF
VHELTLARELLRIIEDVAAQHGVRRVCAVRLEVGALCCVEPHALRFAFEVIGRGTLAENCVLHVARVPLVVRCATCSREGPADPLLPGCPACGAASVEVVAGRELKLLSIDAEES